MKKGLRKREEEGQRGREGEGVSVYYTGMEEVGGVRGGELGGG